MSTVLVVDDSPMCREPLAAALEKNGYTAVIAASGTEALALLSERHPDMVLLDVCMPDLDGIAVLRAMRRNPASKNTPVLLLTERAERRYVLAAVEFGVQGYILKSQFSLSSLLERLRQCLSPPPAPETPKASANDRVKSSAVAAAASHAVPVATVKKPVHNAPHASTPTAAGGGIRSLNDLQPVITREDLIRLVNEGLELRPLGSTVGQVMAATANPACSAEDVAKAVIKDQALSIRVLKLANSSAYSRGRPTESVKEAIHRLGISEVRNLVMALGVVEQYQGAAAKFVDPRQFWEHSVSCGLIASFIAMHRKCKNVDDYFLWGVLHDVGRIILLDHVPEPYANVWSAGEALNLPLETVEPRLTRLDHCDILERALEHWQFPRQFIVPAVNHHHSMARLRRLGPEHVDAAATISLANTLAHALLLGSSGNNVLYAVDELLQHLALDEQAIMQVTARVVDEAHDLKYAILSRDTEEEWKDFRDSLLNRWPAKLRPECLGVSGSAIALRLFFDRLFFQEGEPANFHALWLRTPGDQHAVAPELERLEKESRGPLPLLIILAKGNPEELDSKLLSRPHAVLQAPVRIESLLTSANALLEN